MADRNLIELNYIFTYFTLIKITYLVYLFDLFD